MTDPAVERIARAIYESRNGIGAKPWSRLMLQHKAPYLADGHAALLALSPPEGEAPKGWRLVPVEPTEEMTMAAYDRNPNALPSQEWEACYTAMLAASPVPPLGGG